MQRQRNGLIWLIGAALACAPAACDRAGTDVAEKDSHSEAPAAPSNRVDINAMVRQNLGMTFARVERRVVARTIRIPGRFELLPGARREYRVAEAGSVEILVRPYERIEPGTPLYRLDSPHWRQMQRELAEAQASVSLAQAASDAIGPLFDAHEAHHVELQRSVDLWSTRLASLERLRGAGGASADEVAAASASLASARADLAETMEKEAELAARRTEAAAQMEAAGSRQAFLLEAASTLTGLAVPDLLAPSGSGAPHWSTLSSIVVRATSQGVVQSVEADSGSVLDQYSPVIVTVQPERVRFRAVALQSDLARLSDGQQATVVPAQMTGSQSASSPAEPGAERVRGTLIIAPSADPERRTIDVVVEVDATDARTPADVPPSWARAGVSAFLEVVTSGSGAEELAIPLASIARDGASAIIFRRDPADPAKAIRMEADLGIDDGRWVVIKSGVAEGNEVVLEGVYQLMVATSGSITKGGHFHPDGSFHEGED